MSLKAILEKMGIKSKNMVQIKGFNKGKTCTIYKAKSFIFVFFEYFLCYVFDMLGYPKYFNIRILEFIHEFNCV